MKRSIATLLLSLPALGCILGAQSWAEGKSQTLIAFSTQEVARIASHGPWPMAAVVDAGNQVDGKSAAIELGRELFTQPGLSASGKLSCATCHTPQTAFQDGRRFTRHGRNTPSLLNAGHQRWFGWDGAKDSLWASSLAPLTAADELAATPASSLAFLRREPALFARYQVLFGLPKADETLMVNLAKTLAAYQGTLVSPRTSFDQFRDALLAGDTQTAAQYPVSAQRGLKLFVGESRCFLCHSGPNFSNGEFADIGRPFFTTAGVDSGRWDGLRQVLSSRYNRLGKFSDASPDDTRTQATRHVFSEPRHFGEFKVPNLRNLLATAPYFHDGSAATLRDVVRHYSELDENRLHADGANILKPLKLRPEQIDDLVAFLSTLTHPTEAGY